MSPPPPAYPPRRRHRRLRPPPALPSNVWRTAPTSSVCTTSSLNMKETHSIKVPDQTGYSEANLDRALKWCTTTGPAEMDAAYPENAPYRIYLPVTTGPTARLRLQQSDPGCIQGNNNHNCQTQSSVNRWECNFNRPMNDGVSPTTWTAVYGTGYSELRARPYVQQCQPQHARLLLRGPGPGYIWYRPPLISDPWLDAIDAGTQIQPVAHAQCAASCRRRRPPHPPGAAPTPPPAVPDRQGETQTCFVGPINGYWSDTTGATSSGHNRRVHEPRSCAWTATTAPASPPTPLTSHVADGVHVQDQPHRLPDPKLPAPTAWGRTAAVLLPL